MKYKCLSMKEVDGIKVVGFEHDDLFRDENTGELADDFETLARVVQVPGMVMNFEGVKAISSTTIGLLITLANEMKFNDAKLVMCNVDPKVYEIFKITRLDHFFQTVEDESAAIAAFK